MRFGIKYKLFVILLSASVLIIACMFVFTRISFEHGLIRYMDNLQMNNLETMCQVLGESYEQDGSWQFLKDNPEIWDNFQRYILKKWRKQIRNLHRPHRMDDGKQNVAQAFNGQGSDNALRQKGHKNKNMHPEFVLLDRNKEPLVGQLSKPTSDCLMPVIVNMEIVGYLGMNHPKAIIQEEELLFFQSQTRVFLMIAMTMVIISIIVAVWTAFYLERPIRVLTKGTWSLASGDYKTRIPVTSNDELGQLSLDFNTLAKTLEENETDRKKWVEDIAHDLRTPLTLLNGELEAVQDGVRELTPETIVRLQGDILHLIRLVNDLNELSRTDKGSMAYKKVDTDLSSLIRGVTDRYAGALDEHHITVEYREENLSPVMVFADPERLKQLFGNIIQNALDYTHPGGLLRVTLEIQKEIVHIDIEDSKPGVPAESLPRLFDRLYRVEGSRNRKFGGSGLGLSICKNIVEAHGGSIVASQSLLGGLRIEIDLPLLTGGIV